MTLLRIQQTVQVTLTHTFVVGETPTAPTGTLEATVKRAADGTAISGSPFTYSVAGTECSFALPAQANLDILTVDWAGTVAGAALVARDTVEIVGGFYFGLGEARTEFALAAAYTTEKLAAKRLEVEDECERICRRAFVPRFAYQTLTGSGTERLAVKHSELRTLRAVTVDGVAWATGDVSAVILSEHGVLRRPAGALWPQDASIVVEYEHGLDFPPEEVKQASMLRLRSKLGLAKSNVPRNALSYTVQDGGTYRLTTPGRDSTGDPDVDAAYQRHARYRRAVIA